MQNRFPQESSYIHSPTNAVAVTTRYLSLVLPPIHPSIHPKTQRKMEADHLPYPYQPCVVRLANTPAVSGHFIVCSRKQKLWGTDLISWQFAGIINSSSNNRKRKRTIESFVAVLRRFGLRSKRTRR